MKCFELRRACARELASSAICCVDEDQADACAVDSLPGLAPPMLINISSPPSCASRAANGHLEPSAPPPRPAPPSTTPAPPAAPALALSADLSLFSPTSAPPNAAAPPAPSAPGTLRPTGGEVKDAAGSTAACAAQLCAVFVLSAADLEPPPIADDDGPPLDEFLAGGTLFLLAAGISFGVSVENLSGSSGAPGFTLVKDLLESADAFPGKCERLEGGRLEGGRLEGGLGTADGR